MVDVSLRLAQRGSASAASPVAQANTLDEMMDAFGAAAGAAHAGAARAGVAQMASAAENGKAGVDAAAAGGSPANDGKAGAR